MEQLLTPTPSRNTMNTLKSTFRCILAIGIFVGVRAGVDALFSTPRIPTPNLEHSFYHYAPPINGNRPFSINYPSTCPPE
jgi:hypothetical protein